MIEIGFDSFQFLRYMVFPVHMTHEPNKCYELLVLLVNCNIVEFKKLYNFGLSLITS